MTARNAANRFTSGRATTPSQTGSRRRRKAAGLRKQLRPALGELHISAALVHVEPAPVERRLQPGAVFRRLPSCTASIELAISISLRAAASGSAWGRLVVSFIVYGRADVRDVD